MSQSPTRLSIALLAFWTGSIGAAYLGLLAFLLFAVPVYEREFLEQRVRLPMLTEFVIAASRWAIRYWYDATLMFLVAYVAAGGLLGLLRPREEWRKRLWILWLVIVGFAATCFFSIVVALQISPFLS